MLTIGVESFAPTRFHLTRFHPERTQPGARPAPSRAEKHLGDPRGLSEGAGGRAAEIP